jgi:hypothetical protein
VDGSDVSVEMVPSPETFCGVLAVYHRAEESLGIRVVVGHMPAQVFAILEALFADSTYVLAVTV